MDRINIGIVDDHPLFVDGVKQLLIGDTRLSVVFEADNSVNALEKMKCHSVDLVILDQTLNHSYGMDLLKDLKTEYPHVAVLFVSMHDESYMAKRVRAAGADGYLMKSENPENILLAIQTLLNGETYFRSCAELQERDNPVGLLSDREFVIFILMGQGKGTKEIAEELEISIKTVETHKSRMKKKLGITDAIELQKYCIQWG
ncbi:MAG: response regulator [Spirochaeta sp.]